MRLGSNLADDTGLEDLPERRDRLSGGAVGAVPAVAPALKEEGSEVGDLDSRRVVAVDDARSLDDARIRPVQEFLAVMSVDGSDQGRVRAASLVEDEQTAIAKLLALALQARQQLIDGAHPGDAQIASGFSRSLDGHQGNLAVAGLDGFECQSVGMNSQRRLIAKGPPSAAGMK